MTPYFVIVAACDPAGRVVKRVNGRHHLGTTDRSALLQFGEDMITAARWGAFKVDEWYVGGDFDLRRI